MVLNAIFILVPARNAGCSKAQYHVRVISRQEIPLSLHHSQPRSQGPPTTSRKYSKGQG